MESKVDLVFICRLTSHFDGLWPVLGNVSRDLRDWAREVWSIEAFRCAIRLRSRTRKCFDELGHRLTYLELPQEQIYETIQGLITLQGIASFVHHCILVKPAEPWCHEQLLCDHGVDVACMVDFPVTGEFTFDHIVEYLTRAGELRVFMSDSEMDWGQSEPCIKDAAKAYHRLLRTIWAWPCLGITGWVI